MSWYSAAGCVGVLAAWVAAAAPVPNGARPKDAAPSELPRGWDLAEIEEAAPPYGAGGRVSVLAWKVVEDDRPLRVETCLVLKDLGGEAKDRRWCLAHLYRHPLDKDPAWRLPPVWVSPPAPLGPEKAVVVDHFKRLKAKPGNKDVYDALGDVQWRFELEKGWKLVGCGVCEKTWEAATGERPTRFFERP